MPSNPQTSFYPPPEVRDALERRATREGRSLANLVLLYVQRGLDADGEPITTPAQADKAEEN